MGKSGYFLLLSLLLPFPGIVLGMRVDNVLRKAALARKNHHSQFKYIMLEGEIIAVPRLACMENITLVAQADDAGSAEVIEVPYCLLSSSKVVNAARSSKKESENKSVELYIPCDSQTLHLFAKGIAASYKSYQWPVCTNDQEKQVEKKYNNYTNSLESLQSCKIENVINFLDMGSSPLGQAISSKISDAVLDDPSCINQLHNPITATKYILEPLVKETRKNIAHKIVKPIMTINNNNMRDDYDELVGNLIIVCPDGSIVVHDNAKMVIYNPYTGDVVQKIYFNDSVMDHLVHSCLNPTWKIGMSTQGNAIVAFTNKARYQIDIESYHYDSIRDVFVKIWGKNMVWFGAVAPLLEVSIAQGFQAGTVLSCLETLCFMIGNDYVENKLCARSHNGTLKVFDAKTGALNCVIVENGFLNARLSNNGEKIGVIVDGKDVKVYDAHTGNCLSAFVGMPGENVKARALVFSPDDKKIAVAELGKISIWDYDANMQSQFQGHGANVVHLVFSSDGEQLLSTSDDGEVRLWNMSDNQVKHVLSKHTARTYYAKFSPNNKTILSTSQDLTAMEWDTESGELLYTFTGCTDIAKYSSDGTKILVPTGKKIEIYDAGSHELLCILQGHTDNCAAFFTHDGKKVVGNCGGAGKEIKMWDLPESCQSMSTYVYTIDPDKAIVLKSPQKAYPVVQFKKDGEKILTGMPHAGQNLIKIGHHDNKITDMELSKNRWNMAMITGVLATMPFLAIKSVDTINGMQNEEDKAVFLALYVFGLYTAYTYGKFFLGNSLTRLSRYYS